MVQGIVLRGSEFAIGSRSQPDALLRQGSVADGLKHHFTINHEFHRAV
jgi:hypothetical protein